MATGQKLQRLPKVFILQVPQPQVDEGVSFTDFVDPKLFERGLESNPARRAQLARTYALVGDQLLEVQKVADTIGSTFVGNYCLKSNDLYICTPQDPLFILLPWLRAARKTSQRGGYVFEPVDTVLDCPELIHLIDTGDVKEQLKSICDVREKWGEYMCNVNDAKLTAWLRVKHGRIKRQLESRKHELPPTRVWNDNALSIEAAGVLTEYVPADIMELLCKSLGITSAQVKSNPRKRKRAEPVKLAATAYSTDNSFAGDTVFDYNPKVDPNAAKKAKLANKPEGKRAKQLRASRAGTKSLFSFFKKKT